MNLQSRLCGLCRFSVIAIALVATGWLVPSASAGELDKMDNSLRLVPEDAAFYSSMMRNREQIEAVVGSNAWARIKEMPIVQMGMMFYQMQLSVPDSGPAKLAEAMENPESRKIIDMLLDMGSEEVFFYGDDSVADLLKLTQDINGAQNFGSLSALVEGKEDDLKRAKIGYAISALAEDAELIVAPNLIVGFKITNMELAKEQLIKLETIGNIALETQEETKGRFRKTKVGGHDFLTLELDGAMIPWDEVPLDTFKEYELEEGEIDAIVERIKQSKLVIALGLRGDYLVLSIGPSLDYLKKLGEGPRLIDRKEFKPLAEFAGRRLASIGYVSEEMNRRLNNQKGQIDEIMAMADQLLPETKLTEEQQKRVLDDAKRMGEDLKSLVPEVGALAGFSFLTDRGIEGYRYNWGDMSGLDGTKQLGLLEHVGGNPVLGLVFRQRVNIENYDLVAKWAKAAFGYFEDYGLPSMQDDERRKAEEFLAGAKPLFERMDKTNREKLIPSLADGQSAFALDVKMMSKQLVETMPPSEEPLPMFEPAIVLGLSDANLFRSAMHDYWDIVNGMIDAIRKVEGTNVPEDLRLPEPKTDEISDGELFCFPLPEEWGLDKQIVPNMGISKNVAVMTLSKDHSARLMQAAPLSVGGLLAETDRPLAVAGWFDWAAMVDAASPWVDYFLEVSPVLENSDDDQREMIVDQVHTAIDLLKVLRKISSECYFKDGALVSHSLVELQDVE